MRKQLFVFLGAALVLMVVSSAKVRAGDNPKTLVITMTNDPEANAILVFDAATHARLQTLSTNGKGGAGGNARGVAQYNGRLVAAVNNKSGTVAVFEREGDHLVYEQTVVTTSPPLSVDFANGHMYVAGSTRVDSFVLHQDHIGRMDGTTALTLSGGAFPPDGSTAQVGAADSRTLLVTLKSDPTPGTVDVIALEDGAISGEPEAVSGPAGTLAPFGFSVYPDGTALISLAHSGHDGLFRSGAFSAVVVSGGQTGNCWTTRIGKYVFVVNTGSRTISRVVGTGSNIFVDAAVAATIPGGSPTDTDANGGYLGVIDHSSGPGATSHLTLFRYNAFGELLPSGQTMNLAVPDANGLAIIQAEPDHED